MWLVPFCIPFLKSTSEPVFVQFEKAVLKSLQKWLCLCRTLYQNGIWNSYFLLTAAGLAAVLMLPVSLL